MSVLKYTLQNKVANGNPVNQTKLTIEGKENSLHNIDELSSF